EINGGEPLTRKKLVILLTKELKKHFLKVGLNSNGSLINKEVLNQLEQSGLDVIKISFYSLNKETHNYLRGCPQAFDSAQKAIELIQKSKINLEVALLITAQNIKEAPELIQHLQTLPNISIIIQPLDEKIESQGSRNWHSNNLITSLWPKEKDVNNFFDFVLQNNQKIKNPKPNLKAIWQYYLNPNQVPNSRCFTGQRNLVIYPNANVSLCFKGETIGNLNEQNLKKILKNAKSTRKKIKKCPKYCHVIGCNYSRGFKELFTKR
ncbi:radical SAM protein, partial [Candidatus Falkowbacteria bacterium]|nr:radical SAM protein [Candidatus Falkowbacteria bacterium]